MRLRERLQIESEGAVECDREIMERERDEEREMEKIECEMERVLLLVFQSISILRFPTFFPVTR